MSLSKDERDRVFTDEPPGAADGAVKEYVMFARSQRKGPRRVEET